MRLLLFDIDGTLVSVEHAASRAMLRKVVEEIFSVVLPTDFEFQLGGKTDYQIMTEVAQTLGLPITMVEEQKEKALRKRLGIDDIDEYAENDKALKKTPNVEIVDAEIVDAEIVG